MWFNFLTINQAKQRYFASTKRLKLTLSNWKHSHVVQWFLLSDHNVT